MYENIFFECTLNVANCDLSINIILRCVICDVPKYPLNRASHDVDGSKYKLNCAICDTSKYTLKYAICDVSEDILN